MKLSADPFPPLPALRKLATLRDGLPVVVIDTREQTPLAPQRLPWVRDGLQSGDYSVRGLEHLFAVERKSVADLVGCCKSGTKTAEGERERFERELHRLRGFRLKRLLIIGTRGEIEDGAYRSNIQPSAVLNTLRTFEARYDVPVVYRATPEAGAWQVEEWAYAFAREIALDANGLARGVAVQDAEKDEGKDGSRCGGA